MDDRDLYSLSLMMPNEFADYLLYDSTKSEDFAFRVSSCLDFFAKHDAHDFIEYMSDWPLDEILEPLYKKMLNYCNWFKPMVSDCNWASIDDITLFSDCGNLYCYLLRWRDIIAYYMPNIVKTTPGSTEEGKQPDTTEEAKQPDSEPNNMAASTSKKSGRQSKPFETIIGGDKERMRKVLTGLHALIGDKRGKDALIYIAVAFDMGVFSSRPTYTQVTDEFGYLGNRSTFGNWIELCSTAKNGKQISTYNEGEITAAKQALERALNQD
jgi:hypothetical protein